ncbi:MAG: Molybdenum cofactor biosysynthesis protein [Naasia sp.]|nr:Molybdenum cofactor biosysynthesis protein [Naasia sp.]
MIELRVEIVELLVSPVHRFQGRPGDGPLPAEHSEFVSAIELRASLGIAGDRYFGRPAHRDSSVSIQSAEAVDAATASIGVGPAGLTETRRNVLLRGVDTDALAGHTFGIDSGDGEVLFGRARPCRPCGWLEATVGPGAHRAFRGRGGLRTAPLTDGRLRLGPATLRMRD